MHPCWAMLILPYTRAELPAWGKLMDWLGFDPLHPRIDWDWAALPIAQIRGKHHGFLMNLDRSDWSQRVTYFIGRYYELGVQRTLDVLLRPGDRFVDIGANIGMITLHARSLVGASGRVDCFEPNPECVQALQAHLRINGIDNVVVHPCALAEQPGKLTLNLFTDHSGSATLADLHGAALRSMPVEVGVGDELIDGAPRAIKIDVEGFELHVLRGLARTLSAHKPFVLTELIESQLARCGTSVAEVSGFLFDLGYAAYGIGSMRQNFRHRLALRPLARGGDFGGFADALWVHPAQRVDLGPHVLAATGT